MRQELSQKYAPTGLGLEIAAFHNPWPSQCEVVNMDLFTADELRKQYPEVSHKPIVETDITDDANFCKTIPSNTYDFLFSSHVLEHMPFVVEAINHWLRVVKSGGHVIMAIPHKDNPIDKNRKSTNVDHLWNDYCFTFDYDSHYREYFEMVDGLTGEALRKRCEDALCCKPHVHFHCWDEPNLLALFRFLEYKFDILVDVEKYELIEFQRVGHEIFVVLKKL